MVTVMKKIVLVCLLLLCLCLTAACEETPTSRPHENTGEPDTVQTSTPAETNQEEPVKTVHEQMAALRQQVYDAYVASVVSDPARGQELKKNQITYVTVKNRKMKVETKVTGKMPEGGYPIFIVLHGGGSDPTGEMNESQWSGMAGRYINGGAGIFVSCRAIEDTWNCHSVDGAFAFYDRILEDAVLFLNGNPNKAYVVGYSAGGDGVYQIAPRMADRFAAANMTAGHPNGISPINLYHTPMFLQVGELDSAYGRNTETVKYSQQLDQLQNDAGDGYIHGVFVHVNKEHGVVGDNARQKQTVVDDTAAWLKAGGASGVGGTQSVLTHAVALMTRYTRDPVPTRVIWDLSTRTPAARGVNSFYWLSAPVSVKSGVLDISYDKTANAVTVNRCTVKAGKITVYLNEDMVDFSRPLTFVCGGKTSTVTLTPKQSVMEKTLQERGDYNFIFADSFTFQISTGEVVS